MSEILYMPELISLEAIRELVEYKTNKSIKMERATDRHSNLTVFIDSHIELGVLTLEDYGLTAIDKNGQDRSSFVRCIIFDDELKGGRLLIQGSLLDLLIIDNKPVTHRDIEILREFNQVSKAG